MRINAAKGTVDHVTPLKASEPKYDLKLIVGNRVVVPRTLTTETSWDDGPIAKVTFFLDLEEVSLYAPDARVELFVGYVDETGRNYGTTKSNWRISQTDIKASGEVTLTLHSLPNGYDPDLAW